VQAGLPPVTVIGGGLAGSEATRVLAAAGIPVRLHEMRPVRTTPAHESDGLAEIVCSNSLGSTAPQTSKGVLLEEMRRLGSLIVSAAEAHSVPAGASLAVERAAFSKQVTSVVHGLPDVEVVRGEVKSVPANGPTLLATGPLTSDALAASLAGLTGKGHLAFYDAIAPIVTTESLDHDVLYAASRYGRGDPDFLNCPLDEEQYSRFVSDLLEADKVEPKDFEKEVFFEGCMPIEEIARRGPRTLAFGPMRPVGLPDPRTGFIPHAVIQLRREDPHGQLYNLVGFQTKLKHGEQKRIFRTLPGFGSVEFARLGSIHRNTFLNTPALLAEDLSLRTRRDLWFGGLLVGVEGYAECAASGLMAALGIVAALQGRCFEPPPPTTMLGGLMRHLREADPAHFQPMNVNFGLLPPVPKPETKAGRAAMKGKRARRLAAAERALTDMDTWIQAQDLGWLGGKRSAPVEEPA
jgi:methylenetetrahydrofolate--tRNA-(uracil-5-)-methyltransferase